MGKENIEKAIYEFPKGTGFINSANNKLTLSSGSFEQDDDGNVYDTVNRDYVFLDMVWTKPLSWQELKHYDNGYSRAKQIDKTARDYIAELKLNRANVDNILDYGNVNGTLLIDLENMLRSYGRQCAESAIITNKISTP